VWEGVQLALVPLLASFALACVVLMQQGEDVLGVHVGLLDVALSRRLLNLVI